MSGARDAWSQIKATGAPTRGEFRVFESNISSNQGVVLFALDSIGRRHLLIPAAQTLRGESDQRSSGVQIVLRDLVDGGIQTTFVDIVCLKPHLDTVFDHLIDEVLDGVRSDPARPLTVARRVLGRWRELLERSRPGVLSEQELLGLYGELYVLNELCTLTPAAIRTWRGPAAARHDFQSGSVALETKTTTSRGPAILYIHGVDQLSLPEKGQLYLVVIFAERTPNAGQSVPDLVRSVRALGVDGLELTSKLTSIGYAEEDVEEYTDITFSFRMKSVFEVDDDFPRIIRSSFVSGDLPARVSDVRYAIDVSPPIPASLDGEEVAAAYGSLLATQRD